VPLFLIERQFADELKLDAAGAAALKEINDASSVNWLFSFLSADLLPLRGAERPGDSGSCHARWPAG
jgi:hypothetical protein